MSGRTGLIILVLLMGMSASLVATASGGTYSGGTGEPNNPYKIATAADMNEVGANPGDWNKHFVMVNDVNLAEYTGTQFNIIGTYPDNPFRGVFDGNDHKISNFTYDSNGINHIGLFGYVNDPNAQIKDLGLIDPNVDGGMAWGVGSLVGWLYDGSIINCYVEGGNVSGGRTVGGLVGANRSNISNSSSATIVEARDSWGEGNAGGLVGATNGGVISKCYAGGNVVDGSDVGGLVGFNAARIADCYSTASVSGTSSIGGLVGFNPGGVINCYSVGQGAGLVGWCGDIFRGTVTNSFWDIETSGDTWSDGGTGKTTVEMKQKSTFTDWDFVEIWGIEDSQTYPFLKLSYPLGDLNYDFLVDIFDFAILASHWLEGVE